MTTKEMEYLKRKYGIEEHGGGQWGIGFLEGLKTADKFNMKGLRILLNWLNKWADYSKHPEYSKGDKLTPFGEGYQQAVRDIYDRIEQRLKPSEAKP